MGKSIKVRSKRLPLTEACGDGGKFGVDILIDLMISLHTVDAIEQFWQDLKLPVIEL